MLKCIFSKLSFIFKRLIISKKKEERQKQQLELYNHYQAHRFGVDYKENIRETIWLPVDSSEEGMLHNCPGTLNGINIKGELTGEYRGRSWIIKLKKYMDK